jgi:hypothetical protein
MFRIGLSIVTGLPLLSTVCGRSAVRGTGRQQNSKVRLRRRRCQAARIKPTSGRARDLV